MLSTRKFFFSLPSVTNATISRYSVNKLKIYCTRVLYIYKTHNSDVQQKIIAASWRSLRRFRGYKGENVDGERIQRGIWVCTFCFTSIFVRHARVTTRFNRAAINRRTYGTSIQRRSAEPVFYLAKGRRFQTSPLSWLYRWPQCENIKNRRKVKQTSATVFLQHRIRPYCENIDKKPEKMWKTQLLNYEIYKQLSHNI